jgi:hypothetical protein
MAIIIVSGSNSQQLVNKVNAVQIADGVIPIGGILYTNGTWFQVMTTGDSGVIPYVLAESGDDVAFAARANFAAALGCVALGEPILVGGRITQAFGAAANTTNTAEVLAIINAADDESTDYDGLTAYVIDLINAPDTVTLTDPLFAGLKSYVTKVLRTRNQAFRASFTTTSAEATQLVTVANTPQVITFNAQAIPNAILGTLDNATGVFTVANDFTGMLTLNAQIRRGLAGNTTWAVQIETSPDGVTWTPSPGSSRRILLAAGESNLVRFYDFTTAITAAAGTRVRFTQMVSDATNNTGIVALASALGGTTAAGFIFSLYSLN